MTDSYGEVYPNVRCITCNKVIASIYDKYVDLVNSGVDQTEIWKELGVRRTCCMTELMRPPKVIDNSGGRAITILSGDPKDRNLRTKQGRINNNLAVLAMGNSRRKKTIKSDLDKPDVPFSLASRRKPGKNVSKSKPKSRFILADKKQPSSLSLTPSTSTATTGGSKPLNIPTPSGSSAVSYTHLTLPTTPYV